MKHERKFTIELRRNDVCISRRWVDTLEELKAAFEPGSIGNWVDRIIELIEDGKGGCDNQAMDIRIGLNNSPIESIEKDDEICTSQSIASNVEFQNPSESPPNLTKKP